MNYLGHLFFSGSDYDLMYANLFGDFVRGTNYTNYSHKLVQGIKLHRSIDDYFDKHPSILTIQRKLYKDLPKVSGIAMDMYADHWLAVNWSKFNSLKYQDYLNNFYSYDPFLNNHYPLTFKAFVKILKEKRWMDTYATENGLDFACRGLSNRLSFTNALSNALLHYKQNKKEIDEAICLFMKSAIEKFLIDSKK